MARKQHRQPRPRNMNYEAARMMRGTTDLMMASGTLMVGAGALGIVKGALHP